MKKSKIEVVKSTTKETEACYFASTKVCDCGDIMEVKHSKSKRKGKFFTKRIDGEHYVDVRTGEVFEYKKEYQKSIDSFFEIKRTINRNFKGTPNEMFITLTYAEELFDNKLIANNYKAFWRKFKRAYPNCEDVRIAEPNDIGAWHIHCLIKNTNNNKLDFSNEKLSELWGLGKAFGEPIYDVYGLSNYFIPSFNINATEKAQAKARRINYYTKYFRNFTSSKGIIVPEFVETDYEDYCQLIKDYWLRYSSGDKNIVETLDDGRKICLNTTRFEEYENKNSVNQNPQPELSGKGKEVDE